MKEKPLRTILGISFFTGTIDESLDLAKKGGLVVMPSGPNLADLPFEPEYQEAVMKSDLVLLDSGFLKFVWWLRMRERLPRNSGLKFLIKLVSDLEFLKEHGSFWVMPSEEESMLNKVWLKNRGIALEDEDCYVSPIYARGQIEDQTLKDILLNKRPRFIVINIAGGVQEKLGYYLRCELDYKPTIICTGAAIAFLTGKQAAIPPWADRYYLGWLLRCIKAPNQYIPRYWKARHLFKLIWRYKDKKPG